LCKEVHHTMAMPKPPSGGDTPDPALELRLALAQIYAHAADALAAFDVATGSGTPEPLPNRRQRLRVVRGADFGIEVQPSPDPERPGFFIKIDDLELVLVGRRPAPDGQRHYVIHVWDAADPDGDPVYRQDIVREGD
jgi:hypothetical protein